MIFVLAIITMFVVISIYFFFKAENLQRELILMKRDISATKKENKSYIDMMAIVAQRYEEISKQRLVELRSKQTDDAELLNIIAPMIMNYAAIFNESMRAKGKLQSSVKKVYDGYQTGTYKALCNFISQSDKDVKRAWSSNNINGFIMLIEAFLQTKSLK